MVLVSQKANADFFSPLNKDVDPLQEINQTLQKDSESKKDENKNTKNSQKNQSENSNINANSNVESRNFSEIDENATLPAGTAVYYSPFVNNGKSIAPIFGVSLLKDPFPYAANAGFEFINTAFANFLFLGAGLNFQMGFPKETFPYTYKAEGKELDSPCYLSLMAYAPIGLFYAPFKKNRNIQLEMATRLGAKASGVFSLQTTARSDLHFAFYSALLLGLDFYKFNLALSVSYDTTDEFGASLYFSYRFRIGKKPNNSGFVGIVQNGNALGEQNAQTGLQGAGTQSTNSQNAQNSGSFGYGSGTVNGENANSGTNYNGGTSSFSGNAGASGTNGAGSANVYGNVANENNFANSGAGATNDSENDATSATSNAVRPSGSSSNTEPKIRSPYAPDGEVIWTDGTVKEYSHSTQTEAAQ